MRLTVEQEISMWQRSNDRKESIYYQVSKNQKRKFFDPQKVLLLLLRIKLGLFKQFVKVLNKNRDFLKYLFHKFSSESSHTEERESSILLRLQRLVFINKINEKGASYWSIVYLNFAFCIISNKAYKTFMIQWNKLMKLYIELCNKKQFCQFFFQFCKKTWRDRKKWIWFLKSAHSKLLRSVIQTKTPIQKLKFAGLCNLI